MTIQEYFRELEMIQKEYGPRSLILMQDGAFYEVYGVETPELKLGFVSEVSRILNMRISFKKGKKIPHGIDNPKMVGFPDYALDNHLPKLLFPPSGEPGFIVAQYDQVGNGKKGKIRELVKVHGPSSIINDDFDSDILSKYSMCVLFDHYMCPIYKEKIEYMDLALINLITGDVYLYELYNTHSDPFLIKTDLHRILSTFNIVEIISSKTIETNIRITVIQPNKEYFNIVFQEAFLNKIYPGYDDFSRGRLIVPPFIHLLTYLAKYDPSITNKLKFPVILEESQNLVLNNDSIEQLHLFPSFLGDKFNLFHIVNRTKTKMGERLLKMRLSIPEINPDILNKRYEQIENARLKDISKYQSELKNIIDIDKKYRKWILMCERKKGFQPNEMESLYSSFLSILNVLNMANNDSLLEFELDTTSDLDLDSVQKTESIGSDLPGLGPGPNLNLKSFILELESIFDFDILKTWGGENYFKIPVPELDEISNSVSKAKNVLEYINQEICLLTGSSKLEKTEKEGYYINITKSKYKASGELNNFEIKIEWNDESLTINDKNINRTILSNNIKLTNSTIKMLSDIVTSSEEKFIEILNQKFIETLIYLQKYGELIIKTSNIIAEIDVIISNTYTSLKYGYSKPEIIDEQDQTSFILATDLRHPVIEYHSDNPYVSNDINLHPDSESGIILYGLNLAGKSTFLRSVGLSVIMAQAGMYVPASSFIYYPFSRLISKITIRDEPEHNKSTFMVEVSEIKDICERSSKNTLVILDESGSSTEQYSGTSLIASLIDYLTVKKTSFIVSTHLNELQDLDIIKNNSKISIQHFNVTVENGKIHLDRKIKPGGMNKLYGLEIAQALGLQPSLLKTAFEIRNTFGFHDGEILSTKKSRYNQNLIVDECSECGSRENLQTHHIRHQSEANEYGLIDGCFHKNKKSNLKVLCGKCHEEAHASSRRRPREDACVFSASDSEPQDDPWAVLGVSHGDER